MRFTNFWRRDHRADLVEAGAKARALHGAWLTRALGGGAEGLPRIPVRRVDRGGFDRLMARPRGRQWAQAWWDSALRRIDGDATDE